MIRPVNREIAGKVENERHSYFHGKRTGQLDRITSILKEWETEGMAVCPTSKLGILDMFPIFDKFGKLMCNPMYGGIQDLTPESIIKRKLRGKMTTTVNRDSLQRDVRRFEISHARLAICCVLMTKLRKDIPLSLSTSRWICESME